MKTSHLFLLATALIGCTDTSLSIPLLTDTNNDVETVTPVKTKEGTWQHFLQHLPVYVGNVVDYRGKKIENQSKHFAIVNYDIGNKDLQQCADALIRLRAEFLFSKRKFDEIGFHFTSGDYYTWNDYCLGKRPVVDGNRVIFTRSSPCAYTHEALRKYLDIVFAYAGTKSLYRNLKTSNDFKIGSIIITPGSPGHCCIIVDEAITSKGEKVYKLVEGYMPAQSIYVLRNPYNRSISPWYKLSREGTLYTSSYQFTSYQIRSFD